MTSSPPDPRPRATPCRRCGALNGADFDRCIRCGAPLSPLAAEAEQLQGLLDGRRLAATWTIVAITSLVFAGQLWDALARGVAPGSLLWPEPDDRVHVNMLRFGSLLVAPGHPIEEFRVLSAVFVHFGLLHFAMNMFALRSLARIAEPAAGSARFVVAYVVTGILGFGASALCAAHGDRLLGGLPFDLFGPIHTAGASGAVFGVMGLILGWLLRRRDPRWKQFAMQAVVYSLVFGVLVRANNVAHVGGLLAGIPFGLVYAGPRRPWAELVAQAAAALSLAACVAALVLAQRSPLWRDLERRLQGRTRPTAALAAPPATRPAPARPPA